MVYTVRLAGIGRQGGKTALEKELARRGITRKNGKPHRPTTQGKVERFQQGRNACSAVRSGAPTAPGRALPRWSSGARSLARTATLVRANVAEMNTSTSGRSARAMRVTLAEAQVMWNISSWPDVLDLAHHEGLDVEADRVWALEMVNVGPLQMNLGMDDDPDKCAYLKRLEMAYLNREHLPPLVLLHGADGMHELWDGIHRATAAYRAGLKTLPAWVAHIHCPLNCSARE